jgi:hypothetical protein
MPCLARTVLRPRGGASLAVTLCVLILIECVVIGTLHLAMQERHLADAGIALLRLRLAADAAVAEGLQADWAAEVDGTHLWQGEPAPGYSGRATIYSAGTGLFMIRGAASEPPPGYGLAISSTLVRPPVLPPSFDIGRHLQPPGTAVHDAVADSVIHRVLAAGSLAETPGVFEVAQRVDDDVSGVVIGRGDVRIASSVRVRGLFIVAGVLTLEPGAQVSGAVVAYRFDADASQFTADAVAAMAAVRSAALLRARPVRGRQQLPGF